MRVELALPMVNDSLYEKDVLVPGKISTSTLLVVSEHKVDQLWSYNFVTVTIFFFSNRISLVLRYVSKIMLLILYFTSIYFERWRNLVGESTTEITVRHSRSWHLGRNHGQLPSLCQRRPVNQDHQVQTASCHARVHRRHVGQGCRGDRHRHEHHDRRGQTPAWVQGYHLFGDREGWRRECSTVHLPTDSQV